MLLSVGEPSIFTVISLFTLHAPFSIIEYACISVPDYREDSFVSNFVM